MSTLPHHVALVSETPNEAFKGIAAVAAALRAISLRCGK